MTYATRLLVGAAFSLSAAGAHAQAIGTGTVWKCMEQDNRAHYTNIKKETEGKWRPEIDPAREPSCSGGGEATAGEIPENTTWPIT